MNRDLDPRDRAIFALRDMERIERMTAGMTSGPIRDLHMERAEDLKLAIGDMLARRDAVQAPKGEASDMAKRIVQELEIRFIMTEDFNDRAKAVEEVIRLYAPPLARAEDMTAIVTAVRKQVLHDIAHAVGSMSLNRMVSEAMDAVFVARGVDVRRPVDEDPLDLKMHL